MKNIIAASAFLAVLCAGCASSIKVSPLDLKAVSTGVPWNLAMTQYTVTITRQVTECTGKLAGTVTVSAIAGKKLDSDQQYVLSSSGVWSTADITSTLSADGTSLGLNAHSESQAAAIVSSSVGLLAAAAPFVGAGPPGVAPPQPLFICSDSVKAAQALLKPTAGISLKEQVDQETKELAMSTAKVTQLTSQVQASAGKVATDKTALSTAMNDSQKRQQKLTDDQAKLTTSLKVVTTVQTVLWPPSGKEVRTPKPYSLDEGVMKSWIQPPTPGGNLPIVDVSGFDVFLALYKGDGSGGWLIPKEDPSVGDVSVGVPVRLPRVGRLVACAKAPCTASLSVNWIPTENQTLLVQPDAAVLQFGQLYNVPITGGTFKSEGAVIALDAATGVPTSIEVFEKTSVAAGALSSAQSAVTTLAAIPAQVAAAELAKIQAATNQIIANNALAAAQAAAPTAGETAAATAQTSFLNATNSLATAQANALAAGPVGQLAAQTAIATQQAALATQQSALANANAIARLAPAVDTIGANTSLLNAQATQINAEVALAKARAALQP